MKWLTCLLDRPVKIKQQTWLKPSAVACVEYWLGGDTMGDPIPQAREDGASLPDTYEVIDYGMAHVRIWTLNGYPLDMSMEGPQALALLTKLGIKNFTEDELMKLEYKREGYYHGASNSVADTKKSQAKPLATN